MNNYRMGTKCVQAGYKPGNGEPRQIPIIQSTTFKYDTSEDMGKLFDLEAEGYFYSRLQNPTCDHVAAKIAAMEGGTAAMLTSSGQAVEGTNITDAKHSIERSMDLLVTAFENQLDKLFQADALDVNADIAALEGMLNLDGLTGSEFTR